MLNAPLLFIFLVSMFAVNAAQSASPFPRLTTRVTHAGAGSPLTEAVGAAGGSSAAVLYVTDEVEATSVAAHAIATAPPQPARRGLRRATAIDEAVLVIDEAPSAHALAVAAHAGGAGVFDAMMSSFVRLQEAGISDTVFSPSICAALAINEPTVVDSIIEAYNHHDFSVFHSSGETPLACFPADLHPHTRARFQLVAALKRVHNSHFDKLIKDEILASIPRADGLRARIDSVRALLAYTLFLSAHTIFDIGYDDASKDFFIMVIAHFTEDAFSRFCIDFSSECETKADALSDSIKARSERMYHELMAGAEAGEAEASAGIGHHYVLKNYSSAAARAHVLVKLLAKRHLGFLINSQINESCGRCLAWKA